MKYSIEQLGFILYNNRSVEGTVKNFLDTSIEPLKLINIEKKFDWCKSLYANLEKMVEVDLSLLDPDGDDVIIKPNDLSLLTPIIKSNLGKFSDAEKNFLKNRKITDDIVQNSNMLGLSNIKDYQSLVILGATCHPILKPFLQDGIEEGAIVFPLFENGNLVNCAIRRISDIGKLKYTLAVPDTPVWGLDDINKGDEIWITEGLFDMYTLRELGFKAASPSSAMWSGIQLYKLLEKKPSKINIFCDDDRVGLKTGLVLNKFFNLMIIDSDTYYSPCCKDIAEHILEKSYDFNEIKTIKINRKMIEEKNDNSFDFLRYLQKRKF
jgi:hypothetical protein